ncbi:MAG: ADP-ribosylglycohydrolase family protein [Coraliomargarita sp.]
MNENIQNAMLGALVADAFSMPVHWYYDTSALDRDYPNLSHYCAPRNPHPDSILWRSRYTPKNKGADILHDQAKYWGQRGIHYHQHLPKGENTLNCLLGALLYRSVVAKGAYDADDWLSRYISVMRTPGWHQDTYVEEYHRAFFENLAHGHAPHNCGIKDIHIGGLAPVPFLLAALDALDQRSPASDVETVQAHLALTHKGSAISQSAQSFVMMLNSMGEGVSLRDAILEYAKAWVTSEQLDTWSKFEDRLVVGRHLTSACYLPESFTASLFLVWKYHDRFCEGIRANALCGGDNAHRGVVVGALLAAANGIPEHWLRDLKTMGRLRCDSLDPNF